MIRRRVFWTLVTLLSTLVVMASLAYYRFDPALYFEEQRAVFVARQGPLYLHITGALIALLVGPWQFLPWLRRRHVRVHRAIGAIYLLGCLVGGVGGLLLATTARGGLAGSAGFAALGTMWLVTGALGLRAIVRGNVVTHRRWMTRSFALTFAAVTLRLYLGTYYALADGGVIDVAFDTAYGAIAWLCWLPNLAIAWWWTRVPSERPAPTHAPGGDRVLV